MPDLNFTGVVQAVHVAYILEEVIVSRESFAAFVTKLQQNESLQKELRDQLGDPAQGGAEGLQKFAASKGYDFSVEDIIGELSDKQLDTIAGGLSEILVTKKLDSASPSL